jgi:hypothetical protein
MWYRSTLGSQNKDKKGRKKQRVEKIAIPVFFSLVPGGALYIGSDAFVFYMVIIDVCLGFWTGCVYSELLSNFGAIFGVSRSDE